MKRISGTVVQTGVLALALALAGCGGGGSGDSAPVASAPPVAIDVQRDVQGTAAKGLIKGAKVSVHAIDAQGVRAAAALATAITGADGTYKLQIPASVHNFVIEVSAAPGAVMADEATGTDIAIPEGMKLRSVVTLAGNATGTYVGSVTPLTEMVARTAETTEGKLPPQAVAQAKTSVRTLLGFDPETVKPVNSNSAAAAGASEDEKNQSLALAAISKMATTATADCGQSNPGERISCVVSKLATSVTVKDGQPGLEQNRLAQFRDAIQSVAQDKTINRTGKEKVVGLPVLTLPPAATTPVPAPTTPPEPVTPAPAPEPAPTTPVPLPPPGPAGATPTQLAATKALFGSLRTNLRSLNEGDAFRSTVNAIKADVAGTVAPLGNDVSGLATFATSAVALMDQVRVGPWYRTYARVLDNVVFNSPVSYRIANGEGGCDIVISPLSMTCTVVQNSFLPGSAGFISGTRVYSTRVIKLQPKAGSTTDYTYTAFLEKNTARYEASTIVETVKEPIGSPVSGEMSLVRAGGTLMQLAVKGRMTGRLNAGGTLDSDYEYWLLNVARTEEANGLALYKLGGEFTAMVAGQPAGKVEIDNTSFLRVALPATGGTVALNAANELQLTMRGIVGGTTVSGTLRASDGKQDKSKTTHVPTKLSFDGWLKHKDATVFSGNVAITRNGYENFDASLAESDTNFVADTVEIAGALAIPNRPKLSLVVGATRIGPDAANISAQYRDGTSVINASVTAKVGERYPLVKVSSAEGVAFSFAGTSVPVPVTKDGAVVAQIDLGKGIITYSDGSTESLK
ncbi:MAG: hypothetical protein ABWY02_01145 [Telluria sp.]